MIICCSVAAPLRAETIAGYLVTNVAQAGYTAEHAPQLARSNQDAFRVAERLDIGLTRVGDAPVTVTGGTTPVPFTLTNFGNGEEAFLLDGKSDVRGIGIRGFAVDANGDGLYNPAIDRLLSAGQTAVLAPAASIIVFALIETPETLSDPDGIIALSARAATGSGAPGTIFQGRGTNDGDAVVGLTGASAEIQIGLTVIAAGASLTKSQTVAAPDGSAAPVRGAIVTYVLTASFFAPATDARIEDRLPASMRYIPDTLLLDDAPISDAGNVSKAIVSVALGDVDGPGIHTLQFKVKVQ